MSGLMRSALTTAAAVLAAAALTACGDGEPVQFTQISAGAEHTCGLRTDGSVICWGSDASGQLNAPADERFTAITAGGIHTCGLREDGTSICWGFDLFASSEDVSEETRIRAAPVFPPEDEQFTSISASAAATCGLRANGDAVCWDVHPERRGEYLPFETEQVTEIAASAAGLGVCGLRLDGSVLCEDVDEVRVPPEGERFAAIGIGFAHFCGLRANGSALCWGDGSAGQLSPTGNGSFSAIALGTFHTCGLRTAGSVECWGYDWERFSEIYAPPDAIADDWTGESLALRMFGIEWVLTEPRTDPPSGERFTAITAGSWHTCGLRQDGGVSCWGYNNHGQASPPPGRSE